MWERYTAMTANTVTTNTYAITLVAKGKVEKGVQKYEITVLGVCVMASPFFQMPNVRSMYLHIFRCHDVDSPASVLLHIAI
jgi:hypothetical protein